MTSLEGLKAYYEVWRSSFKKLENTSVKTIRRYPLQIASGAILFGMLSWGAFNWSMELTNTEHFCISCHVMKDNVYKEYQKSPHFKNRTGVRATCPDCHVPKEWIHKVVRKVQATSELYHWARGTISTPEKFEAERARLAGYVWNTMKSTNSRECRNCHDMSYMKTEAQKTTAAMMHVTAEKLSVTCIDCHKGIAHNLPKNDAKEVALDKLHDRFKKEKVNCRSCHKDMAGPPPGEEW